MKKETETPRNLNILGVMTGTSCDGIDAACVSIDPDGWQILWTKSGPYPAALRRRVLEAQKPGVQHTLRDLSALHRDLGEWYGTALASMIRGQAKRGVPDVIANHGQTIGHFPEGDRKGTTVQLGDPTRIARTTGITVISGFRDGDMAAGGQGAPLVPRFHQMLAHHLSGGEPGIAIHNLGGISNLTYLGPRGKVIAFDTGPGNAWIDAAAAKASGGKLRMDKGGDLAYSGDVDSKGMDAVLKHPFFAKAPPKSTGRDEFPFELLLSKTKSTGKSLVATATAVTVESIARAYEKFIIRKKLPLHAIYLSGGGARNPLLLEWLGARLPSVEVLSLAEAGFDPQFIEAQAFAMFGLMTLMGEPIGGIWTGAKGYGPPGAIVPAKNWDEVTLRLQLFSRA